MSPSAKKRKGILGSGEQPSADQSDTPNKPHVTRTNATLLRFYRGGLPSSVEASIFSVFCCGRVFRARPEGSKKDHLKFPQWPEADSAGFSFESFSCLSATRVRKIHATMWILYLGQSTLRRLFAACHASQLRDWKKFFSYLRSMFSIRWVTKHHSKKAMQDI